MIREVFVGTAIIILAIVGYNIGNYIIAPLEDEARGTDAPGWVLDTVLWGWNHWVYIMIATGLLLIFIGTQLKQSQEWFFD